MTRYFLIAPDRFDNMSIFNGAIEGTILTEDRFDDLLCESDGHLYEYMCAEPKVANPRFDILDDWDFYCHMLTRSGEYHRQERRKKYETKVFKEAGLI